MVQTKNGCRHFMLLRESNGRHGTKTPYHLRVCKAYNLGRSTAPRRMNCKQESHKVLLSVRLYVTKIELKKVSAQCALQVTASVCISQQGRQLSQLVEFHFDYSNANNRTKWTHIANKLIVQVEREGFSKSFMPRLEYRLPPNNVFRLSYLVTPVYPQADLPDKQVFYGCHTVNFDHEGV